MNGWWVVDVTYDEEGEPHWAVREDQSVLTRIAPEEQVLFYDVVWGAIVLAPDAAAAVDRARRLAKEFTDQL